MPTPNQVPPLTWIRAFCEAGRQGSFKAAARELGVSPSTISHEIRKLEDWLHVPLFDRSGRAISLTQEGRRLFEAVRPAFDGLAAAFDQFAASSDRALRIGMFPFFASEFFVPRLPDLESLLNGRSVKIVSSNHLQDLSLEDPADRLDAVIRYGTDPAHGLHSIELTRVQVTAVVSANLADGDLKRDGMKRVRMESGFDGWGVLEETGIPLPPETGAPVIVDNYVSGLRAVEKGLGLGIALLPLAESWIQDGRLRVLSNRTVEIPERYWFVCSKNSAHRDILEKIALWLKEELSVRTR